MVGTFIQSVPGEKLYLGIHEHGCVLWSPPVWAPRWESGTSDGHGGACGGSRGGQGRSVPYPWSCDGDGGDGDDGGP